MFTLAIAALAYAMLTAALDPRLVPLGVLLLACSLILFEWARTSIKGRFFSYAGSDDTPEFLWTSGPFGYIRNPFYTSYFLSYLAVGVMFPSLVPPGVIGVMALFYMRMARHEERKFARSPLAEEYAAYSRRTGRFFPKFAGR
jgi:protein-S-isoprenylcysteine O-methyltransferase Ste14